MDLHLDAIATTLAVGVVMVGTTVYVARRCGSSRPAGATALLVLGSLAALEGYVTAGPQWARRRIGTLAFSLFWFIVLSHWLHLIPALSVRAPTSDINVTVALALVTLFVVHLTAAQVVGARSYLRRLATPAYVLPLRAFEILAKTVSLSLRLFGVLFASVVIVDVVNDVVPPPASVFPLAL